MLRILLALALSCAAPALALAQADMFTATPGGKIGGSVVECSTGAGNAAPCAPANPLATVPAPSANGVAATAVTCGTTSTPFGVTGAAYLHVQVPPGGQSVGFAWGASATATMAPPSVVYPGGTDLTWAGGTGACIVASGTQAVTVETR